MSTIAGIRSGGDLLGVDTKPVAAAGHEHEHEQVASLAQQAAQLIGTKEDNRTRVATLEETLEKNASFHIEYHRFLSNHMPHGLIALYNLGASSERLKAWEELYSKENLEPPQVSQARITTENWKQWIGQKKEFPALVNFFLGEITMLQDKGQEGVSTMVNRYFPHLVSGVSGAALHPLIHLGFALSAPWPSAKRTLAEGFAYCVFGYHSIDASTQEIKSSSSSYNSADLFDSLQSVINKFSDKMHVIKKLEHEPPYNDYVAKGFQTRLFILGDKYAKEMDVLVDAISLNGDVEQISDQLTLLTFFLYAISNNDFFMLHGCTGIFALRHVMQYLANDELRMQCLRYAVKYLIAVWIAQGLPGANHQAFKQALIDHSLRNAMENILKESGNIPEWKELIRAGVEDDDEHTQKMVFVSFHLQRRFDSLGSELLRYVAWKRLSDEGWRPGLGVVGRITSAIHHKIKHASKSIQLYADEIASPNI